MSSDHTDLSWPFLPPKLTKMAAIMFVGVVALGVFLYVRDRRAPKPPASRIAYIVLAAFAGIGLHTVMRGGGKLDGASRQLVRWWGLGFPVVRRTVRLDAVQAVVLGVGPRPGSRQGVRPRHRWFHVALRTDDGALVVRLMKSRDAAEAFGKELAGRVGAPFESDVA